MEHFSPRLTGAVLVAALHGFVIVGLLAIRLAPEVRRAAALPEAMIVLPALIARPVSAPHQGPLRNGTAGITVPSDLKLPFAIPPAAAANLGLPLFACAPENLKNLGREAREKCLKLVQGGYLAMREGLPVSIELPGPEWKGLRNSDIRARERNTADPCLAAKATGTDCIHEVLFGKGLW
jgi:hypothetical protein